MRLFCRIRHHPRTWIRILTLICLLCFAADVFDLRDEVLNVGNVNGALDDNITMGIPSIFSDSPLPVLIFLFHHKKAATLIASLQNIPYSDRAPPTLL